MSHLPPLIIDLAFILFAGAISTLIFSRLRQPIVLGYLIAGFVVGPHFPLWPNVVDTAGVALWAEIGVIFLLFGLGLEFSFKKLAKVGKSAFIAAFFEIVTMSAVGYLFGRAIGWGKMDSIYLGAILSMSSTTIIIRAFDEAKLKGQAFASLVFGILIVEDLMAILIMVILSAISVPGSFSETNLLYLSGRLIFFLIAWFLVGIYVLPTAFRWARKLLNDEILLIVSISLCFLMVVLATKAEFSAALGAFIMGSILAETNEGERIEHLLTSVKDLFAAIFFVSVGMLINPAILREHFGVVVMITLLTIFGKLLGSGFGAVLSGRSLRHSTQAGMSLAQIGEFSFIIATLGVSLNVVSDFLYPIIIAVSAVTTFTTPYMIKFSGPMYSWLERKLPTKFIDRMNQYQTAMNTTSSEGPLKLLWRTYGPLVLLNTVVVLGITLASSTFALPMALEAFGDNSITRVATGVLTIILCSPFLMAVVLREPKKLSTNTAETLFRLKRLQFGLVIARSILGLILVEFTINRFTVVRLLPIITLISTPVLIFIFRKYLGRFYSVIEGRFLKNLNAKELAEVESLAQLPQLAPWDATLQKVVLSSDSRVAGQSLEECKFRSQTGATVAMIDRGNRRIFAPSRSERLLPNDEIFLVGTDEQMALAQDLLKADNSSSSTTHDELFGLEAVEIHENSAYVNRTIRDVGFGEQFGGLVVGIERQNQRMLNPESTTIIERGDVVWIFGHRDRIRLLKQSSII